MTGKEFINRLAKGESDIIQVFLDIFSKTGSRYCLIGGLAVNAYVEPVVSLDMDIVAAVEDVGAICKSADSASGRPTLSEVYSQCERQGRAGL